MIPGGELHGNIMTDPVADWSFTDAWDVVQLENAVRATLLDQHLGGQHGELALPGFLWRQPNRRRRSPARRSGALGPPDVRFPTRRCVDLRDSRKSPWIVGGTPRRFMRPTGSRGGPPLPSAAVTPHPRQCHRAGTERRSRPYRARGPPAPPGVRCSDRVGRRCRTGR